jgi:hypothetical protein
MSLKLFTWYEKFKFDLNYTEVCDGSSNLWKNYTLILLKSFGFLWQAYGHKIYYHCNFYKFHTKFRYYYNYYILILEVEPYITNNWIVQLSMINGLLWNLWVQYIFYAIFWILFHLHVVPFQITFDMHS